MEQKNKIILFQDRKIRRIWREDEWYFSAIDIVGVLTDSANPRDYWYKMKIRVKTEDGFEPSTVCRQFKMVARRGGTVAGNARKETEKELGRSIVSEENYLSDNLLDNDQNKKS